MDESRLYLMLGELTAKVDQILVNQTAMNVKHADLDERLTKLETFKTKAVSTIAAVAATAGGSLGVALRNLLTGG